MLAVMTKLTLTQVSMWFANARRRIKKLGMKVWSKGRCDDDDIPFLHTNRGDPATTTTTAATTSAVASATSANPSRANRDDGNVDEEYDDGDDDDDDATDRGKFLAHAMYYTVTKYSS